MSIIARFEIEYLQYLNAEGQAVAELPPLARERERLVKLYQLMSLVRVFDSKAIALQRTGKLGTYASCLGHEAAHVGIGAAMQKADIFAPMYREYGTQIYRGVKPREILLYWGGDERGNNYANAPHDYAWSVPISTQCLHAAGAAMALKIFGAPTFLVGDEMFWGNDRLDDAIAEARRLGSRLPDRRPRTP